MSIIGESLVRLDEVDSTNSYAAEQLAAGNLGHGTVVMARWQTAGRGQRGRTWHDTPDQDLLVSVVLLPEHMQAMAQFQLAKAVALAVKETVALSLQEIGKNSLGLRVKWPNDILVDGRKLAGILIENEVKGDRVASSVVGIGINVNSTALDRDLNATSLRIETGRDHDIFLLLERLCVRLQHWWERIGEGDRSISNAYHTALWARDRFTEFTLDGSPFVGRPLDVDERGRLIVEDEGGGVTAYGLDRLRHQVR